MKTHPKQHNHLVDSPLAALAPDLDPLIDLAFSLVDDTLLWEIAGADYGEQQENHFAALQLIRETRNWEPILKWVPGEVLELIRWSEPEDETWKPGLTGVSGHRIRLLSCALLLRGQLEVENARYLDPYSNVVQLLGSAFVLGADVPPTTVRFLAAAVERTSTMTPDRGCLALGCLLSLLKIGTSNQEVVRQLLNECLWPILFVGPEVIQELVTNGIRTARWQSFAQEVLLEKQFPADWDPRVIEQLRWLGQAIVRIPVDADETEET